MMLFLRDLPHGTTREALKSFVERHLPEGWLLKMFCRPRVIKSDVLKMLDETSGDRELHGLIRITPKRCGNHVIKRLNGLVLMGKPISVRPYVRRHRHDRRVTHTDPALLPFPDRRKPPARRRHMHMTTSRPVLDIEHSGSALDDYNWRVPMTERKNKAFKQ